MLKERKKALVIINPTAGKQAVKSQVFSIVDNLNNNGYLPTVLTTGAKGDATEYIRQVGEEYDMVLCCGGDGTLNETVTGVMSLDKELPIGYIPCGSTNDMANNLGIPKVIKKSAKEVIEGEPLFHDIGLFGDMAYFTYIASFGAFTKVSYSTPQSAKNVLGHFAYVLNGALELGNIKSYHTKITYDGGVIEDNFIYVSASNTRSFAGMFSFPKDDVSFNDGLFEVLLIKTPKNVLDVSSILHSISTRKFAQDKNMVYFRTDKLKVETEQEVVWTIDGESSPAIKEVDIEVVPDKIRIFKPKADDKKK